LRSTAAKASISTATIACFALRLVTIAPNAKVKTHVKHALCVKMASLSWTVCARNVQRISITTLGTVMNVIPAAPDAPKMTALRARTTSCWSTANANHVTVEITNHQTLTLVSRAPIIVLTALALQIANNAHQTSFSSTGSVKNVLSINTLTVVNARIVTKGAKRALML
jgi:hypothetical protein